MNTATGRSPWETRSLIWSKLAQGASEATDDLVRDVSSGKWAVEMKTLAQDLGVTLPNSWAASLCRDKACTACALHDMKMGPQNAQVPSQAVMGRLSAGIAQVREQLRAEMDSQRLRLFSADDQGIMRYCEHGWEEDTERGNALIERDIEGILLRIAEISANMPLAIDKTEPLDSFANLCALMASLAALAVSPDGVAVPSNAASQARSCYDECYAIHVGHWMPRFADELSRLGDQGYYAELGCYAKLVVPLLS